MELGQLAYIGIAVLGLVFGSFFNVAIHRWPQEEPAEREWVRKPSHCPKCKTPIKWFDNVPVFSWLMLRGRCRACQAPISPRYILVELGTSGLWVLTSWLVTKYGMSGVPASSIGLIHLIFALVFASLYLLTVVIDAETQIIPDEITLPHFACAWLFFALAKPHTVTPGWESSVIMMLALPALFFLLHWLNWMGGGDVALAAGFGALFGWPLSAVVALFGFMLGGLVALPVLVFLVVRKRYEPGRHAIAFGPFLAISAYLCLFFGHSIVNAYFSLFGLQVMQDWTIVSLRSIGG